jgi:hypothetical protein
MSGNAPPILCRFEGGVFKPARASAELRAKHNYVEGETYEIVEYHPRSIASHNHYFASVEDAWKNLPEIWAQEFANADHLRKYALIKSGFYDCSTISCPDAETAGKVAAFAKQNDEFAIVSIEGCVVRRFTAKSQSYKSMGRDDFRASKEAVLDLLASMIGTNRDALERNAVTAA